MKFLLHFFIAMLAVFFTARATEKNLPQRPNIILLLSDDQDWNGLSTRMHPDIPESASDYYETPHLAKFAAGGMRFSNGYAPAPVCSPTRISLLTGMTPARLGWTKAAPPEQSHKLIEGDSRKAIRDDETTFAELLRRAGYATAHFGKWHLLGGGPERHGFEVSDGDTGNRDADAHTDPNPVDIFGMTDRAEAFIEKNSQAGKPFYLQMSYHALHLPQNALRSSLAHFQSKPPGQLHSDAARAAITRDLDTGVGRLLDTVRALGLDKNTYIVFMADNGGGGGKGGKRRASVLSGGKGGLAEGGIRVPFLVCGPGITPGSWCHKPVIGYDWFPTFCHLAGVKESLPEKLDGGDLLPLLMGKSTSVERSDADLVFHFPHYQGDAPQSAIREGDFKLVLYYEDNSRRLFDLSKDAAEKHDLSNSQKDDADRLEAKLRARLAEAEARMPTRNPSYDPTQSTASPKGTKKGKSGKKNKDAAES